MVQLGSAGKSSGAGGVKVMTRRPVVAALRHPPLRKQTGKSGGATPEAQLPLGLPLLDEGARAA